MSSADTLDGWSKRHTHHPFEYYWIPSSSRDVDRELQRIKSLAVVSERNKAFSIDTHLFCPRSMSTPLTSTSWPSLPSSAELSSECNLIMMADYASDTHVRTDPNGVAPSLLVNEPAAGSGSSASTEIAADMIMKFMNTNSEPVYQDSRSASIDMNHPVPSLSRQSSANTTSSQTSALSSRHSLLARIEILEKHYAESSAQLEASRQQVHKYREQHMHAEQVTRQALSSTLEQKELESVKVRELCKVVLKQEQLVCELECRLDHLREENEQLRSPSLAEELQSLRKELAGLKPDMFRLVSDRETCERTITMLRAQLAESQEVVRKTLDASNDLQTQSAEQQAQTETKLQQMTNMLQEKDQQLRRYRERFEGRVQAIPESKPLDSHPLTEDREEVLHFSSSRSPSCSSSSCLSPALRGQSLRSSCRSSCTNTSMSLSSKRSYIRWPDVEIPPAKPPPTDPLPKTPTYPSMSSTSTITTLSITTPVTVSGKDTLPAIDSFTLPASPSPVPPPKTSSEPIATAKRASLFDFAKQLDDRLSLSNGIKDLCMWEPTDFHLELSAPDLSLSPTSIVPTPAPEPASASVPAPAPAPAIASVPALSPSSSRGKPKEGSTFWKGVKKRFRV